MVLGPFGMMLGSFGDRFGMEWGWFWHRFCIVLVSCYYGFGMVLGWFRGHSGVVPGSFWDRSGSILGWFGDGFKGF